MPLFDAHCHLEDERLANDLPAVLRRAEQAEVRRMLCCGCNEANWNTVLDLARTHREIVPSFGIHPWHMQGRSGNWIEVLERYLAAQPSGVGEIGLDHAVVPRVDEEQESVFLAQLRLARKLQRPLSIHCRKAWGRLLSILDREGGGPWLGLIHSYSGSAELVKPLEEMGWYISFSGAITRPENKRARQALKAVSPGRLLIETDSPDLLPVGLADAANEPANLALVAACAAQILERSPEWVSDHTFANAGRLFAGIVQPLPNGNGSMKT